MAPTSTWRTIRFSKPGAQPPVYLVGSFSSPPWDPTEMQYTIKDGEYEFRKEIEVEAGQRYQYKIRIGESEWALNENEDKDIDEHWNQNNLLVVPPIEDKPAEAEQEDAPAEEKATTPVLESEKEGDAAPTTQAEEKPLAAELAGAPEYVTDAVNPDVEFSALPESIEEAEELQKTTELDDKLSVEPALAIEKQIQGIAESDPTPNHTTTAEAEPEFPATTETDEVPAGTSSTGKEETNIEAKDEHKSEEQTHLESPQPVHPYSASELVKPDEAHERSSTDEEFPALSETTANHFETSTSRPEYHGDDSAINVTRNANLSVSTRAPDSHPPTEPGSPGQEEPPTLQPDVPYSVEIRAKTPDYALTAAEVAESAELLDQSPPTPPMSDEEAGRTGYRRMSNTPIPEVANTAAEVADTAAKLDKESLGKLDIPHPRTDLENLSDDGSSYPPTPEDQRAPRFPYECLTPADIGPRPGNDLSRVSSSSDLGMPEEVSIDLSDPSLTMFPTTLPEILQTMSEIQARLPEDEVTMERTPRSPNFIPVGNIADLVERQSNSPASRNHEQSPSLDSIAEEEDDEGQNLHRRPTALKNGEPVLMSLSNGRNRSSRNTSDGAQDDEVLEEDQITREDAVPEEEDQDSTIVVEQEDETSDEHVIFYAEENSNSEVAQNGASDPQDHTSNQHATVPVEENSSPAAAQNGPSDSQEEEPSIAIQEVRSPTPVGMTARSISPVAHLLTTQAQPLPVTPFIENRQLAEEDRVRESSVVEDGPSLIVQPPTPGTSLKTKDSNPMNDVHVAKSTSVSVDERSDSQLSARKRPSAIPERPLTPTSMHSNHDAAKSKNWLKAFLRVVFVDWIGGFIRRICGGGRDTLYFVFALLVVGMAVPMSSAVLLDSPFVENIRRSVQQLVQKLPTLR